MEYKSTKIEALINLLDDPDENIYEHIRSQLLELGPPIIPSLEAFWENEQIGVIFQNRIEEIVHDIQFNSLKEKLIDWADNGGRSLLEGIFLIALYQYPELKFETLEAEVKKLQRSIWLELNHGLTAFEKVRVINHMLFEDFGLSGNTTNYHSPQNSFINDVLSTKKGNPISLSILYLLIGEGLGLPIYGINLPRHFIVGWADDFINTARPTKKEDFLFYINPFSKGVLFKAEDIESFLTQIKIPSKDSYFLPCNNLDIINRVLNNLCGSFSQLGQVEKVEELKILQEVIRTRF